MLPKKLLLAVDSEGQCEHALHAALWLARALDAELDYVHAFPPRPILWGKAEQQVEWEAGTELTSQALRGMLTELEQRAPPELRPLAPLQASRLEVRSGHAAAIVVARAEQSGSGLVLLGPHRKRKTLDFGNTVRGVLAKSPCGVWIQPVRARPVRRILVATDLSEHAAHALRYARALAAKLDAKLTALHVFQPPVLGAAEAYVPGPAYVLEDLRRETERAFEDELQHCEADGPAVTRLFRQGDTVETILGLQEQFDLVVMGTHGHSRFAAALLGSVTHAVARSIQTPLLALPLSGRSFLV